MIRTVDGERLKRDDDVGDRAEPGDGPDVDEARPREFGRPHRE